MSTKKTLAGVVVAAFLVPFIVAASEFRTGDSPSLSASEKIATNLYIAGGNVSSAASVAGDVWVAGGNLVVDGAVAQDVAAAGGSIIILGNIGGDLRLVGGNMTIRSAVKGDVVAASGQTDISGSGIGGDVYWAGGNLVIGAPITGNVQLRGSNVTINAPIRGDVEFIGDKLTLGSAAVIQGTLTYRTPKEATIAEGAKILGATKYTPFDAPTPTISLTAILTLAFLTTYLMKLACALVFGLIFNKYAKELVTHAFAQPLLEMGRGFVTLVTLPIASIVLMLTVFGIPLGAIGLLSFAILVVFVSLVAPIVLGSALHKWIEKTPDYRVTWMTILTGVTAYTILGVIPLIGAFAKFALILAATGVIIKMKWQTAQEWR
jgi:hypothetical protein